MNKNTFDLIKSLDQLKQSNKYHKLPTIVLKSKENDTSIPTLKQAHKREFILRRYHRWRNEGKAQKLQETYDQNCRIFISLSKQKSAYQLPKRTSPRKLIPLQQREKCLTQRCQIEDRVSHKYTEITRYDSIYDEDPQLGCLGRML